MGQRTFNWLRPFRSRQERKQLHHQSQQTASAPSSPPHSPHHYNFITSRRSSSEPDMPYISDASSSIPYHTSHFVPITPTAQPRQKQTRESRLSSPSPTHVSAQHPLHRVAFRRQNSAQSDRAIKRPPPFPSPDNNDFTQPNHLNQPRSLDFSRMQSQNIIPDIGDDETSNSLENSPPNSMASILENFIPHRPADREPPFVPPLASDLAAQAQMRFSATTPEVSSVDRLVGAFGAVRGVSVHSSSTSEPPPHDRYDTNLSAVQPSRFIFRKWSRSANEDIAAPSVHVEAEYFGATQHDDPCRNSDLGKGELVLLRFLRNTLGPKAQNLAVRLMNKTPITSSTRFSYVLHQATEDSDLDIIRRDLTNGRLYSSGVRLLGGGWCNLLLGDRFTPGASTRQRHELTYRRSSCSCIQCLVKSAQLLAEQRQRGDIGSDVESSAYSAEVLSNMSSRSRTPIHSAMANFVVKYRLPSASDLKSIGASSSSRELEIGSVVRLNYRASAKLKFTEDVRELFGHFAYTGPISHEEVYRRVTTIGVHYYLYNKGKKERKVYIQGELIRLPVQVGVVKLGTQPLYFEEVGATFCLFRKQIMSIYVGEIVLEGNSLGSFIKTGIQYYIGFGEERGVCPVYPNKSLGKARKLGINELLLHHHMVDDLEVRCI